MLPSGTFNTAYGKDIAIIRTKTQWFLLIAGLVLLIVVPPLVFPATWLSWAILPLSATIIAVLGLHVLTGLCGQVSLGQAAFAAVGAYTTAILTVTHGLSWWLTLPCAGLVAGLTGLIFGAPSLRIKGFYLAMSTIAAQFIIIWCIRNFSGLTGGEDGFILNKVSIGGMSLDDNSYYWLSIALVVILTIFAKNIQRTATGRSLIAIRDNELAAQVMGVNLFRYKLIAFFIGCSYAGIAGWLWAHFQLRIHPDDFTLDHSIWYLGMVIVGGAGSTSGALLGATFIELIRKLATENLASTLASVFPGMGAQFASSLGLILCGLIIILFLLFEPRGLHHRWELFKASYRLHPYSY